MKLSAIAINKNGGKKLAGCLESLKFCDEILLIDSGSTDDSVSIAKEIGARIIRAESSGFSDSRNIGAGEAKGEWLLYVDADERVSDKLRKQIEVATSKTPCDDVNSYKIYRRNIILGKWLKYGDWWPDPAHRLIRKSALIEWKGELHEYPIVEGMVGLIKEPLIHLSKDSISEMVHNSKIFAPIEAKLMLEARHPPVRIYHFLIAIGGEFWRRGVIKMGFLDGIVGIILVFYQMFHQFLVYSLLWQMQKEIKN